MKGYEQTRDRNRHLAEQRRREIYTKLPEYGRLDESVGELSVAQAKLLLNGDDEALTRLRSSLREISRQKRELLTSTGTETGYFGIQKIGFSLIACKCQRLFVFAFSLCSPFYKILVYLLT